ncbi:MAG: PAS domain S-box protein, partial [Nitrospira sp.]|nr:PAS domain S-box protein [Nitrospira sp.]
MGKVRCWELLKCNKKECPTYKSKDLNCWLSSGTHCRDEIQGKFLEKMEMCLDCEVFKSNVDLAAMKETFKILNKQFKEFRQMIDREITERNETEKKLLRASDEWRATFDSMPYGVMLLDREFHILRTNSYIANISGLPVKELIGKKCYELIHGKDKPYEGCPQIRSSKTLKTETLELYVPGMNKYFMVYATPVRDDEGLIKAYVHSLIDFTEMKDKEKKLVENRDAFLNMLKELDISYTELKALYEGLIHSFVNAMDAKSPWTKGHSERVTNYALAIAREIGIKEKDIETLRIASLLHDIGKIGTYDIILDKPGRLT